MAVAIVSILPACGGGSDGNSSSEPGASPTPEGAAGYELKIGVKQFNNNSLRLTSQSGMMLSVQGSDANKLKAGDIVVSLQGSGLVRRVVSVTSQVSGVQAATEFVPLSDAFKWINVRFNEPVGPQNLVLPTPTIPGISYRWREFPRPVTGASEQSRATSFVRPAEFKPEHELVVSFNGVELSGSLKEVTIDGDIAFKLNPSMSLKLDESGRLQLSLSIAPDVKQNLRVSANSTGKVTGKAPLLPADFKFGILVGGIPVTIEAGLELEMELSASGPFTQAANFTLNGIAGLSYDSAIGTPQWTNTLAPTMGVETTRMLDSFQLDVAVPKLSVRAMAFGAVGPEISVAPAVRLKGENKGTDSSTGETVRETTGSGVVKLALVPIKAQVPGAERLLNIGGSIAKFENDVWEQVFSKQVLRQKALPPGDYVIEWTETTVFREEVCSFFPVDGTTLRRYGQHAFVAQWPATIRVSPSGEVSYVSQPSSRSSGFIDNTPRFKPLLLTQAPGEIGKIRLTMMFSGTPRYSDETAGGPRSLDLVLSGSFDGGFTGAVPNHTETWINGGNCSLNSALTQLTWSRLGGVFQLRPLTTTAITRQPVSRTVRPFSTVQFSVEATGDGLSYSWQRMRPGESQFITLAGATGSSLSLLAGPADAGLYRAAIKTSTSTVYSDSAALTVEPEPIAPRITRQPAPATQQVGPDGIAVIGLEVEGSPEPLVVWQFRKAGGTEWSGWSETGKTIYVKGSDLSSETTEFRALAIRVNSIVNPSAERLVLESSIVTVIKAAPPSITKQPTAPTRLPVSAPVSYRVEATGSGTLTYQWFVNGLALPGQTSQELTFVPSAIGATAGAKLAVTVDVSNSLGTVTSDAVLSEVVP